MEFAKPFLPGNVKVEFILSIAKMERYKDLSILL